MHGVITTISICITLATGVFTWGVLSANKKNDVNLNITELKNDIKGLKNIVVPLKVQSDTLTNMLQRHISAQIITSTAVNLKLDEVTEKQDKLKSLVTTEFSKGMTPTQVNDMWNLLEKKNNSYNSQLTPLRNTGQ